MNYRLASALICVLLTGIVGCTRKAPPSPGWDLDFVAFGQRMNEAYAIQDVPERVKRIEGLLGEIEEGVPHNRRARHSVLALMTALMASHVAGNDGERALAVEQRWEARARDFLARDPGDGQVVAFLAERLNQTGRQAEAWNLVESSVETVDLDTVVPLLRQVALFVDFLEAENQNAKSKPWQARFLGITERLRKRVPAGSPDAELRFEILLAEARGLLRAGRFDDAESNVRELLKIDGGRPEIVDLEAVIAAGRRSKR